MFFVGIDVSSAKHDCCILDSSRKTIRSFMILNNRKGFSGLSAVLTELAAPENIKIGLEATGIYGDNLANFLRRKGFNVCTINPLLCKKHQSATTLRKTKNDRSDAKNIALIVASEDLQPDQPLSYHIVELKSLSRARFSTVKDRSSLKNKVKRLVTVLFPELLDVFTDLFGASGMALMTRYPSAKALAACNLDTLTELLRTASRGRFGREKAEALRKLAKESIGTFSDSAVFQLRLLLKRIELLNTQIEMYDDEIRRLMDQLDSPILSLPGIGYTLGAMILSEIGDIKRFSSPAKLLAFAGLEPSVYQSGKFNPASGKMVKHGSPFLRWALLQAATYAPAFSITFAAYYDKKRLEGKSPSVAHSHVAKKLVRVIFSLLSRNVSFVDSFAA
jgi:transposase